jgi:CheY-like chemotaxis protein
MQMIAKILYIEDNLAHSRLVRKMLEPVGYLILEAVDGLQGIAVAARERPDLVLLDFNLPDLDGFEIISRLRSDRTLCEVPVVAVTASTDGSTVMEFIAAGFDAFVPKPVDRKQLIETVQSILSNTYYSQTSH